MLCAAFLYAATPAAVQASVRAITGPTPIPRGAATSARDITVVNEKLAFAIAVESRMPYGVPRGGIIDVAPVRDGRIERDRVEFADFIPNDWSAWPNTYQHVQILQNDARQVRIRSTRDWGRVRISTEYSLSAGSDAIHILTTLTNEGPKVLTGLKSGLTLWPNSGFFLEVPGLEGIKAGHADHPLARRVSAYDEDWCITLHAPYMDNIDSSGRDLLQLHDLKPGESRRFDAHLQVDARGDLAPVMAAQIGWEHLPAGSVHGRVRTGTGGPLAMPVVVVEQSGATYGWIAGWDGKFEARLPAGRYQLYATAKGYSQSTPVDVQVRAGSDTAIDFEALQPPATLALKIRDERNAKPLDARISIETGQRNAVGFLGRSVFFTDLEHAGDADLVLAPGHYGLRISSGGGFTTPSKLLAVDLAPGSRNEARVELEPLFDPPAHGWYAADLHHHADQAEGVTPPEFLARSQLAAGLDLLFVSDHDSSANHALLATLAARRGVPFIPGMELSPSWGHFNAYPLRIGEPLRIDTGTATAHEILHEARRLGATVVQANHPFITYGYYTSAAAGTVPGGFDPDVDLLEINASEPGEDRVAEQLWQYWNEGHRIFLTAGTDTHDVWQDSSGRVRAIAHVEGRLSAEGFVRALKDGHAYVTYGPLMLPSIPFGDTLRLLPGVAGTWSVDFQSVAGLRRVLLIGDGDVVETHDLTGQPQVWRGDFHIDSKAAKSWYAVVAEDIHGRKAWSDPLRVETLAR